MLTFFVDLCSLLVRDGEEDLFGLADCIFLVEDPKTKKTRYPVFFFYLKNSKSEKRKQKTEKSEIENRKSNERRKVKSKIENRNLGYQFFDFSVKSDSPF